MRPLNDIAFYYEWLTYGSRLMYPDLLERVKHQFRCMQVFRRDPYVFSHLSMICKDVDVMYSDFLNYVVPDEARGVVDPRE